MKMNYPIKPNLSQAHLVFYSKEEDDGVKQKQDHHGPHSYTYEPRHQSIHCALFARVYHNHHAQQDTMGKPAMPKDPSQTDHQKAQTGTMARIWVENSVCQWITHLVVGSLDQLRQN